ncbi:MAG: alanine racemase, partial [Clostridiales bacterium]
MSVDEEFIMEENGEQLLAWLEIDLSAIKNNIREIRRRVGQGIAIVGVVKADGYGLGSVEISRVLLANGADRLAVARFQEAMELRQAGIEAPILILGPIEACFIGEAILHNITQTVFNYAMAEKISLVAKSLDRQATIHLKIDTGMGRIGFLPDQASLEEAKRIFDLENIYVEGIFSHFATADFADKTFSDQQMATFGNFIAELTEAGQEIPFHHIANSAAIIDLPETYLNMVRPGIILYGYYPSQEVCRENLPLCPAVTLKALITNIKKMEKNHSVGYCRNWYTTDDESLIATVPLGYADGISRLLFPGGQALVNGERAPIVGNVCMDQLMLDISHISNAENIKIGDEVVLVGRQKDAYIPLEELSDRMN